MRALLAPSVRVPGFASSAPAEPSPAPAPATPPAPAAEADPSPSPTLSPPSPSPQAGHPTAPDFRPMSEVLRDGDCGLDFFRQYVPPYRIRHPDTVISVGEAEARYAEESDLDPAAVSAQGQVIRRVLGVVSSELARQIDALNTVAEAIAGAAGRDAQSWLTSVTVCGDQLAVALNPMPGLLESGAEAMAAAVTEKAAAVAAFAGHRPEGRSPAEYEAAARIVTTGAGLSGHELVAALRGAHEVLANPVIARDPGALASEPGRATEAAQWYIDIADKCDRAVESHWDQLAEQCDITATEVSGVWRMLAEAGGELAVPPWPSEPDWARMLEESQTTPASTAAAAPQTAEPPVGEPPAADLSLAPPAPQPSAAAAAAPEQPGEDCDEPAVEPSTDSGHPAASPPSSGTQSAPDARPGTQGSAPPTAPSAPAVKSTPDVPAAPGSPPSPEYPAAVAPALAPPVAIDPAVSTPGAVDPDSQQSASPPQSTVPAQSALPLQPAMSAVPTMPPFGGLPAAPSLAAQSVPSQPLASAPATAPTMLPAPTTVPAPATAPWAEPAPASASAMSTAPYAQPAPASAVPPWFPPAASEQWPEVTWPPATWPEAPHLDATWPGSTTNPGLSGLGPLGSACSPTAGEIATASPANVWPANAGLAPVGPETPNLGQAPMATECLDTCAPLPVPPTVPCDAAAEPPAALVTPAAPAALPSEPAPAADPEPLVAPAGGPACEGSRTDSEEGQGEGSGCPPEPSDDEDSGGSGDFGPAAATEDTEGPEGMADLAAQEASESGDFGTEPPGESAPAPESEPQPEASGVGPAEPASGGPDACDVGSEPAPESAPAPEPELEPGPELEPSGPLGATPPGSLPRA